ncbi:F-box domain-containing protein [Pleomassaria siparia CBS 279.74]|uniref:F-box domain-containing protein n=1 Tax=Pleomassaria siparia CBS 279.74 TaxID=1314801 RepID=A0A6G1JR77_9PLEO|nr:F-box domain-containing protein [Pleomassaria siparia CBS 279.74]
MEPTVPPLVALPSELIHHILLFLSLPDLLSVGLVNHALHEHSLADQLYQLFVQSHVPGDILTKPSASSWRDMFKTHHPYWFIPQNKIWFADSLHTGKVLIARYDPRINAIEAYALVAERRQPTLLMWDRNPDAIVHTFSPRIQLDLNAPVVRLDANAYANGIGNGRTRLQKEVPMGLYGDHPRASEGLFSRLMLTRPWPESITDEQTAIWPPLILPSPSRTITSSATQFRDENYRPSRMAELSRTTFRVRKWMEFSRLHGISMRVAEDITTWATLPEECYTPTPQKPWQGIWCGDYAGHGCEFLAIVQPDEPKPMPERAQWALRTRTRQSSDSSTESTDSWNTAPTGATEQHGMVHTPDAEMTLEDSVATLQPKTPEEESSSPHDVEEEEDSVYHGRIEAIKLTGDPNIPRGEYTFIAPDIGPGGLVRVADEDMFRGARIVRSVGHIAARGFTDDDFIASQLILISHNQLAQYWETFGHVSFYQRVDIESLIKVT